MRKSMKCLSILGLLVGVLGAVTVSASAAEPQSGVYDLQATGCDIKVYTGDGIQKDSEGKRKGEPLTAISQSIDGSPKQLYAGAEAFEVTYTGTDTGAFHLVLMLEGESQIPTAENIGYIDQTTNETGLLNFTVFPSQMKSGKYTIYKSASSGAGLEPIASFQYYQAYKLGYVNDDNAIDTGDALLILQQYVKKVTFSPTQELAADVNRDKVIDTGDALKVLQYYVGRISSFD